MQTKLILIAAGALASLACSGGDPVNIGENNPAKTGEFLSDYAATWDGYVEAHDFASGSDRVRLTLDENGVGYLEVGDMPLVPAPTDPDTGYAVELDPDVAGPPLLVTREGFRYTAFGTSVENSRIQLGVFSNEFYKSWCELQTSYLWDGGASVATHSCIPNSGHQTWPDNCSLYVDNVEEPIDCNKLNLCIHPDMPCNCDSAGCGVDIPSLPAAQYPTRLDGALEDGGNSLVGTLVLDGERTTVRLQRQ
jgi:hypothetical protein